MQLHTDPCGHWLPHEPGGGVRLLFGALLTQHAKKAAIARGQLADCNPAVRALPACGGIHEKQSLHGAAKPQPAPAFRRAACAARKKGRDCSRTTPRLQTPLCGPCPPAAEYTKNSRFTARQSRSLLLLFGALLTQHAKKGRDCSRPFE